MSCDVGKATEGLENELWRRWSDGNVGKWAELIVIVIAELILQPFRCFTYVTDYSPSLPSLYLRHSSFSNPSVASPTSQFIVQPFFRFPYVTNSSLNAHRESLIFKITNSLAIFRLRKPLKCSTRLAGLGIWTRDLPNASLVRYHGPTSLGIFLVLFLLFRRKTRHKMGLVLCNILVPLAISKAVPQLLRNFGCI